MNKTHSLFTTSLLTFALSFSFLFAQNVGIGTAAPANKLHVQANLASDGVRIDNIAANGDPILQFRTNGTAEFTMGVDDSDADKFKIGTTAITTNTAMTITNTRWIGFWTTTPSAYFQMTNGGQTIGANALARYDNAGPSGVALSARNTSATSGYNALEGVTDYSGSTFLTCGIFGLAIYQGTANSNAIGARGHTNEWQGTGVRGSRFNSGGANNGWGGEFYDDLGYTGFLGTISDRKTKKGIAPITSALAVVNQLNPVQYHFDLDKYPNMGLNRELEYGFIAQEVNQVLPEITRVKNMSTNACIAVSPTSEQVSETESFMTMDYTRLIPILTQAVKEQQSEIENLNSKIETLMLEVEKLRNGN